MLQFYLSEDKPTLFTLFSQHRWTQKDVSVVSGLLEFTAEFNSVKTLSETGF